MTFQLIDSLYAGFDTGVGLLHTKPAVQTRRFTEPLSDNAFMPLGFRFGGTVPLDGRPLLDLGANFTLPVFLLGADKNPPTTQLWEIGFSARLYAGL
jgi:hypothetical protein